MLKTGRKRIFGLDLMRALAISLVVFSHIGWLLPQKSGLLFDLLSICGVIGVEIFFVLSGFLIGRIIYRFFIDPDFGFGQVGYFWIRRWFRTLPNYFLALILNAIVIVSIGSQLPDGIWKYIFFIQNFASEIPPFFYESWSLSIEEFAYLAGPLIVFGFYRLNPHGNRSRLFLYMVLIIIFFCTVMKLIYNVNDDIREMRHWNLNLKAVVIYRLDAVYYGVLASYLYLKFPAIWTKWRFIFFTLGVLIFLSLNLLPIRYGILIDNHPAFWNIWYLPLNSIAFGLCLPLLNEWKSARGLLANLITSLSLISYAIYVLHYSIIMQVMRHQIPNESFVGIDLLIYILVYLSTVLLISYLVYKFFEKPLTDLRDHPKIRRKFPS